MAGKVALIFVLFLLVDAMASGHLRITAVVSGAGWECYFPRECLTAIADHVPTQPAEPGYGIAGGYGGYGGYGSP